MKGLFLTSTTLYELNLSLDKTNTSMICCPCWLRYLRLTKLLTHQIAVVNSVFLAVFTRCFMSCSFSVKHFDLFSLFPGLLLLLSVSLILLRSVSGSGRADRPGCQRSANEPRDTAAEEVGVFNRETTTHNQLH